MSVRIEASRRIAALPPTVYAILADYQDRHRRIVSPRGFLWLRPERGGIGAGTRIRFALKVMGRVEEYVGEVTEPEPGRRLVETYPDRHSSTTFIVQPIEDGSSCLVTIVTESPSRGGLAGRIEQFLARRLLMPLYDHELERIADLAEGRQVHEPVPLGPA